MARQIKLFAEMWIRKRANVKTIVSYSKADLNTWYVEPMTDRFLDWLDALARANGASV
jgi:hypothetical protein